MLNKGRQIRHLLKIAISAFTLVVSRAADAADVREKTLFKGPFDMKMVTGVRFNFDCDDPGKVQRRFVYFKSGQGYYKIPFKVPGSGKTVIFVDKKDCIGEEGTVAGWNKIEEVLVSFWRDETSPVKWNASNLEMCRKPHNAVVVVADRYVHPFPGRLEECGLVPFLVTADEFEEQDKEQIRHSRHLPL